MYASSASEIRGCFCGLVYDANQAMIQINPSAPVAMKAHCQPYVTVIHGTTSGATTAPTFVPELKIPVARARSFLGNHSATALIDAGKLPASPRPSANRARLKPATVLVSVTNANPVDAEISIEGIAGPLYRCATAGTIAATLQNTIASANPSFVPSQSMTRPTTSRPIAYASEKLKMMCP